MKNVEIKASCQNPDKIRKLLRQLNAKFIGTDNQTDTYFKTNNGRLKLRQGNIENHLIFYDRDNSQQPKLSKVILYNSSDPQTLKNILSKALGILITVKKQREIYFINNVKFHIDTVEGLGSFIEIEAQDKTDKIPKQHLKQQCQYYLELFKIPETNLISVSYSDLLLQKIQK